MKEESIKKDNIFVFRGNTVDKDLWCDLATASVGQERALHKPAREFFQLNCIIIHLWNIYWGGLEGQSAYFQTFVYNIVELSWCNIFSA